MDSSAFAANRGESHGHGLEVGIRWAISSISACNPNPDSAATIYRLVPYPRYLEQYRVDAIFRVFTLKGQIKILGEDCANAGINPSLCA